MDLLSGQVPSRGGGMGCSSLEGDHYVDYVSNIWQECQIAMLGGKGGSGRWAGRRRTKETGHVPGIYRYQVVVPSEDTICWRGEACHLRYRRNTTRHRGGVPKDIHAVERKGRGVWGYTVDVPAVQTWDLLGRVYWDSCR